MFLYILVAETLLIGWLDHQAASPTSSAQTVSWHLLQCRPQYSGKDSTLAFKRGFSESTEASLPVGDPGDMAEADDPGAPPPPPLDTCKEIQHSISLLFVTRRHIDATPYTSTAPQGLPLIRMPPLRQP